MENIEAPEPYETPGYFVKLLLIKNITTKFYSLIK